MIVLNTFINNAGLNVRFFSHTRSRDHVWFKIIIFLQNALKNLQPQHQCKVLQHKVRCNKHIYLSFKKLSCSKRSNTDVLALIITRTTSFPIINSKQSLIHYLLLFLTAWRRFYYHLFEQ